MSREEAQSEKKREAEKSEKREKREKQKEGEEEAKEDVMWEEARRREKREEAEGAGRRGGEAVLPIEWLPEGPDSVGLVDGSAWSQIAV